jgi:glucokinase
VTYPEPWRNEYDLATDPAGRRRGAPSPRGRTVIELKVRGYGYHRVERATPDGTVDTILQHATKLRYGKFAVGVEVLPDRIVAVLTDHTGHRFAKRQRYLVDPEPLPVAREIGDVARELAGTELGLDLPCNSIVIGVQIGAPVDSRRGVVLHYRNHLTEPHFSPRLLLWREPVPLAAYVWEETGCQTVVENDAASYAVYEQKHGGHETSAFAVILIRDGVGGGVVLGDRVSPIPFEVGHLNVRAGGRKCLCGKTGCIESVAGRRAMTAIVAERIGAAAPAEFVALAGGDLATRPEVVEVFQQAGEAIAQGIGAVLTMFGVPLIVVYHHETIADTGSETPATVAFRTGIHSFRDYTFPPLQGCRLETRPLRPTVGAHGAALVALNRLSFVPIP